jgi:hypothetical protein
MRYLKGAMNYGIHYFGNPKVLEGYSDSNWISDADEIKATNRYDHLNEVNYGSRINNIRYRHI